ncbi:hypothetical protein M432DRAFT_95889 [Thermoascus aurantiacus ATCC 26904]
MPAKLRRMNGRAVCAELSQRPRPSEPNGRHGNEQARREIQEGAAGHRRPSRTLETTACGAITIIEWKRRDFDLSSDVRRRLQRWPSPCAQGSWMFLAIASADSGRAFAGVQSEPECPCRDFRHRSDPNAIRPPSADLDAATDAAFGSGEEIGPVRSSGLGMAVAEIFLRRALWASCRAAWISMSSQWMKFEGGRVSSLSDRSLQSD